MTTPATAMEAVELAERLKLEAQIHAQEARTANATIAEIYQLCTGATGEPGNWNGAEPVRKLIADHAASLAASQEEVSRLREIAEQLLSACDKAATYVGGEAPDDEADDWFHAVEANRAALTTTQGAKE